MKKGRERVIQLLFLNNVIRKMLLEGNYLSRHRTVSRDITIHGHLRVRPSTDCWEDLEHPWHWEM